MNISIKPNTRKIILNTAAVFLFAFALLTLFLSSSVILDLFGIREKEGNYVLFVVWANFISSLLYIGAAYGFIKRKNWTVLILGVSTVILITAYLMLQNHIGAGGIYEQKTVGAMIFRTSITAFFAMIAFIFINKSFLLKENK